MATATKTIRQKLEYRDGISHYFETTQVLFNRVAAFYFGVIEAHPGILSLPPTQALTKLEQLTHVTATNVNPVMPLLEVATNVPALFRRAAIHAALGQAHAFFTSLAKWRKQKEEWEAKLQRKQNRSPKDQAQRSPKFKLRPPVPPRHWNRSVTFYAGQYKELNEDFILLKLYNGQDWGWFKFGHSGRPLPQGEEWKMGSPQVVRKGKGKGKRDYRLHLPLIKSFSSPAKAEKQVLANPELKICAVDLNLEENLAVATILNSEGTPLVTRFIKGGREVNGFRKRLLGWIAINRSKTGLLKEGESDNIRLWQQIKDLDENTAHRVSRRIVEFANQNGATVIVFEHLSNLKPQKGKYSKRSNLKRAYWLKGKIFNYTKYKAWELALLCCRVSPYNTSRECAKCHAIPLVRYASVEGQPREGYKVGAPLVYCPVCGMRGNADRNASIVIGQRFLARYQNPKEKPPTSLPAMVG